jgi:hypothetical protein
LGIGSTATRRRSFGMTITGTVAGMVTTAAGLVEPLLGSVFFLLKNPIL